MVRALNSICAMPCALRLVIPVLGRLLHRAERDISLAGGETQQHAHTVTHAGGRTEQSGTQCQLTPRPTAPCQVAATSRWQWYEKPGQAAYERLGAGPIKLQV